MHSTLPKVLQPLAGRPLLKHVLEAARRLTPQSLLVVHGHGGEAVRSAFPDPDLHWVQQSTQKGTGHALLQTLPYLPAHGTVLVLFGDVPLIRPETIARMLEASSGEALVLLVQTLDNPTGYGRILRDPEGRVKGIREDKDANEKERAIREVNTGIMALPATRLSRWLNELSCANAQQEYYLTDVVGMAVEDEVPIQTVEVTRHWEALGVNDKRQLAELERLYQAERASLLLEAGVTLVDPDRLDIRGELVCGRDVLIEPGCRFEGRVVLGDGVTVGPNCVLRNSEVGEGSHIQAFSHLDGVVLGKGNHIGPYARIRPGTSTAEDVHLGNFVEVKNSALGACTKVNHLSYVGDSTVGARVNVGAGTITCNYDGAQKHRTVIEDDVFVGSDTQLVAPVTVGKGATIGAGSTIVKPVPPGELALSRIPQKTIPGWKRPVKKPG